MLTTFSIKQATVIGPTPPGTGVIYEGIPDTSSISTSPTTLPVLGCLFEPTSIKTTS